MIVVDASVIIKWLLGRPDVEYLSDRAAELMRRVLQHGEEIIQPPHWLAEVSAVLARLSPATAPEDIEKLHALELPIRDDAAVFRRAAKLAIELRQHVFDTLYHAVALETEGATLITADERYARIAGRRRIVTLSAWRPS